MKTIIAFSNKLLLIVFFLFFLSSCGDDGDDGHYYFSVDDIACVSSYWDDNSCLPYGFTYFHYYGPCSNAGTKNYEFDLCSGTGWRGTYSISINSGEDGGVFMDGEDGEDKYYTLSLYSDGKTLDYFKQKENEEDTKKVKAKYFFDVVSSTNDRIDTTIRLTSGSIRITGVKIKHGSALTHEPKLKMDK